MLSNHPAFCNTFFRPSGPSPTIGNLQLLLGRENLEKNDLPFDTWVQTRDRHYLESQLIPDCNDFWQVSMLPEFVKARGELIRKRLRLLIT